MLNKSLFSTVLLAGVIIAPSQALANPFAPTPPYIPAEPGPFIQMPEDVPSKEYSDDNDQNDNQSPPDTLDPGQILKWNGLGGREDTTDFTDTWSPLSGDSLPNPFQVDALANVTDTLFGAVIANEAALLWSVEENNPGVPNDGDDSENIYVEDITGGVGVWAWGNDQADLTPGDISTAPDNDVNDVDGLEIWGPINPSAPLEERMNAPDGVGTEDDDANRYSLEEDTVIDSLSGRFVSVFTSGGNPYVYRDEIAAAIDPLFTAFSIGVDDIDLDAMMIADVAGTKDSFDIGDWIMFSVSPIDGNNDGDFTIDNPLLDVDGGEIFVWQKGDDATFLNHGGHLWDTVFSVRGTLDLDNEDVNALEAVAYNGKPIPEPSSLLSLLGLSALGVGSVFKRKQK